MGDISWGKEAKKTIGVAVTIGLVAGIVLFACWGVNYAIGISQNSSLQTTAGVAN